MVFNEKKFKLISFNFLAVIICMPLFVAIKLYHIQKFGNLSFAEYYFLSWYKLWFLYFAGFVCGCFTSKLMEKIIDKFKIKKLKNPLEEEFKKK